MRAPAALPIGSSHVLIAETTPMRNTRIAAALFAIAILIVVAIYAADRIVRARVPKLAIPAADSADGAGGGWGVVIVERN